MTEQSDVLRVYYSPRDVEAEVRRHFDEAGAALLDYSSALRESVVGIDGDYEIDVVASYVALGMRMRILIECKHHRRPIGRDVVIVLHHKLQASGSQKGAVISTSGFQSGAIEVAEKHRIALFELTDSGLVRLLESQGIPPQALPPYVLTHVWPPDIRAWLAEASR